MERRCFKLKLNFPTLSFLAFPREFLLLPSCLHPPRNPCAHHPPYGRRGASIPQTRRPSFSSLPLLGRFGGVGMRLWKTLAFSLVFRFPSAPSAGRPRPGIPSVSLPLFHVREAVFMVFNVGIPPVSFPLWTNGGVRPSSAVADWLLYSGSFLFDVARASWQGPDMSQPQGRDLEGAPPRA